MAAASTVGMICRATSRTDVRNAGASLNSLLNAVAVIGVLGAIALSLISLAGSLTPFVLLWGNWERAELEPPCKTHFYVIPLSFVNSQEETLSGIHLRRIVSGHYYFGTLKRNTTSGCAVFLPTGIYWGADAFSVSSNAPRLACGCESELFRAPRARSIHSVRTIACLLMIPGILLCTSRRMVAKRRRRRGQCLACGYLLHGLQSARCPECGLDAED